MTSLYWFSTLLFLALCIVGLLLGKTKSSGMWRWGILAVGTFLQLILGVWGLTLPSQPVSVATVPGIFLFGEWTFALDPLGLLVMAVLGFVGTLAALYGVSEYQKGRRGTGPVSSSLVALQFVFTSFLLTAQSAIPMLIAWEGMSLCAYGYIVTYHQMRQVRKIGFVTLAVSEVGFLALVIAVVISAPATGMMTFHAMHTSLAGQSAVLRSVVLILGFIGFGVKSGVLPMQMWMPRAYNVTPPHLTVLLAGGLLNLGIFGILRVVGWVGSVPPIVGAVIALVGAFAVFLGALYAVSERRLPVLLAYSSIENVGLMLVGIGLSISFHVTHATIFAGVAMFAMVVQMVSHAIAKSLCFLAVGEVERRTGDADIDVLGGIYAKMPMVASGLLVGSLTLAGVAPFSGFTSEWLSLQSMLQAYRTLAAFPQTIIVLAGALAAIGSALAFTAFLRLFAFLFTGRLRTPAVESRITKSSSGHAANAAIVGAGVVSALYGFFPTVLVNAYGRVVAFLTVSPSVSSDITPNVFHHPEQFSSLINLGAGLLSFLPMPSAVIEPGALVSSIAPTYVLGWFGVFSLVAFLIRNWVKRSKYRTRTVRSWAGGSQLTFETAQYSATAYSNPYRMLFSTLLRFQVHRSVTSGNSMIPTRLFVQTNTEKWLQSQIYQRLVRAIRRRLSIVTGVQHGYLWGYMTTYVAVLVILLLWAYWS